MVDIMSLLGNYAFPIVACIAMAWYCKDTSDKSLEDVMHLNEKHTEENVSFFYSRGILHPVQYQVPA